MVHSAEGPTDFVERIPFRVENFCDLFSMIPSVRSSALSNECRLRLTNTPPVLEALAPIVCSFFDGVVLAPVPSTSVGSALNFRKRFSSEPHPEDLDLLRDQLERLFVAGFCTHHFLTTFPTRFQVEKIRIDVLQRTWLLESIVADTKLRSYDKAQDKLPSAIAEFLWRRRIEVFLRAGLGFGFWKLGKASSFVRNLYWAGVLLGLMADISTKSETDLESAHRG